MRFLFDPDSQIMQFISRFCDIAVLNVVFLFTCLPVFTIGAACTALYDVVLRMDTEREEKLLSTYFRSFRHNFRQGTVIWLILLLFGAASYLNMVRFSEIGGIAGYLLLLLAMLVFLVVVFIGSWVFPLLSQFRNTSRNMLKNALLLCVGNLPKTLGISIINCFPWVLMIVNFYTFIRMSFLWLVLYFAAAAYFNSRVLKKVLDSLMHSGK